MGIYNYTFISPEIPAIPLIKVQLFTPGLTPTTKLDCEAILDTGSDCTLIPLPLLVQVNAQISGRAINIPVGGSKTIGIPHYVGMIFDNNSHPVLRVFGCPIDDIGEIILIGRDLMNQYRIEFDGVNLTFTIF
ncbi:hypothetical protein [Oscillatoria salina]|uniref:hypothetical protein n=1 Tax=Oscillatoria salina TaxID=331517 RepID=UPI0013BD7B2D|nr:hypothetical protein [Oscillatoria salina]MBZ8180257.1 hypothetical protein [Oscillatoria salina IIICB1]NET89597.1 hypothetical protein [Kamptonema sp. SIO1D9]